MSKKINKHKDKNRKNFLILPIIYFILFYVIIFIIFFPFISTISSYTGLLFSNSINTYSNKIVDIYKPLEKSQEKTIPKIIKNNKEYIAKEAVDFPSYGNKFGRIIVEDCNIDCDLFFGDSYNTLRNGVGIYNGSFIPGYGGTIMISGHNNTYFNGLKNAKNGQIVTIKTSYGTYKYRINDIKLYNHDKFSEAYNLDSNKENLIMYTCYPFDELGLTTMRYFVYAEHISGIPIDKSIEEGN